MESGLEERGENISFFRLGRKTLCRIRVLHLQRHPGPEWNPSRGLLKFTLKLHQRSIQCTLSFFSRKKLVQSFGVIFHLIRAYVTLARCGCEGWERSWAQKVHKMSHENIYTEWKEDVDAPCVLKCIEGRGGRENFWSASYKWHCKSIEHQTFNSQLGTHLHLQVSTLSLLLPSSFSPSSSFSLCIYKKETHWER